MSMDAIINIALAAISAALGLAAACCRTRSRLLSQISGYIAEAESTYREVISGGQKFQIVVGKLYSLVPAFLKPFITEKMVAALTQKVFDEIDSYAKEQLAGLSGSGSSAQGSPAAP